MKLNVAILPGEGGGPEVTAEAEKVFHSVVALFGHKLDTSIGLIGGSAIDETGTALPENTLNICRNSDAILFGAVGGPKWDSASSSIRPEDGILAIRKELGLFANIRPVKAYNSLIHSSPLKEDRLSGVDMVIVRELTGGLYFAQPKKRWADESGRQAVDTLLYSEKEIFRIMKVAFELASTRKLKVTSVDKFNVLETGRLWREIATEVSSDYPDIDLEHMLVDNAAMQLVRAPAKFDVIVSENTFGDILSDEASVLTGSMGMLPSASLSGSISESAASSKASLYEPIHGSAPDIQGKGVANPIAAILSVAMMLRYSFDLREEAEVIELAVQDTLDSQYRTPDLATDKSIVVSTSEMGLQITNRINKTTN